MARTCPRLYLGVLDHLRRPSNAAAGQQDGMVLTLGDRCEAKPGGGRADGRPAPSMIDQPGGILGFQEWTVPAKGGVLAEG